MSAGPAGPALRRGEPVPLDERLHVLQYLRMTAVLLVLLCSAVAPRVLAPGAEAVAVLALGYGGFVLLAALLSGRRADRTATSRLVLAMLLLDAVWLAAGVLVTGGASSPLRYLVLLHVVAVTLVSSSRTGLLLAVWHCVLLSSVFAARESGLLGGRGGEDGDSLEELVVFVVVLWLVALSTAVLSAVNERELRQRRHDLEALTALAERVERAADARHVARLLLDSVTETFGFTRGVVLAGADGPMPVLASHGVGDAPGRSGRPGTSPTVELARRQRSVQLVRGLDPQAEPWLARLLPGAQDLAVVPLTAEGRPVGSLVLELPGPARGRLSERVVTGLDRSAAYAALALRNAWLLEQVQRLAATDGLTKIANRRTFESTLERELARAGRNAEHVSLVMLDIDHFKRLNDEHGHQAGDEVLRNVAAALTIESRDFDTPARYGGEEFAVVLPGCGPDEAVRIAERLRTAVARAPSVVPLTASAGVSTYPGHGADADTLVRAADDALYASKHAGRDRTTQASGVPPEAPVDALLRRAVNQRLGRATGAEHGPGDPSRSGGASAGPGTGDERDG